MLATCVTSVHIGLIPVLASVSPKFGVFVEFRSEHVHVQAGRKEAFCGGHHMKAPQHNRLSLSCILMGVNDEEAQQCQLSKSGFNCAVGTVKETNAFYSQKPHQFG